jgi:hypothetical protein
MLRLDLFFPFLSGTLRSRAGLVYEGEEPESIQELIGSFSTGLYVHFCFKSTKVNLTSYMP